jgi:hypothetical protein
MCECGCTSNDERYTFQTPGKFVYVLTITKGCVECDGAAGVQIERIEKKRMKDWYQDFIDGELLFEKWSDSEGVAIITGHRKHEFVNALKPHLIDTDMDEMDEIGAEVTLEEMYNDSVVRPHFPSARDRKGE